MTGQVAASHSTESLGRDIWNETVDAYDDTEFSMSFDVQGPSSTGSGDWRSFVAWEFDVTNGGDAYTRYVVNDIELKYVPDEFNTDASTVDKRYVRQSDSWGDDWYDEAFEVAIETAAGYINASAVLDSLTSDSIDVSDYGDQNHGKKVDFRDKTAGGSNTVSGGASFRTYSTNDAKGEYSYDVTLSATLEKQQWTRSWETVETWYPVLFDTVDIQYE